MFKQVFITYSSKDKVCAEEICRLLERCGIDCWIAPRDIEPTKHYGEAIIDAIETCSAIVLILSEHANKSIQVTNEVERAASKGKTVSTIRIQEVQPSKALELFISSAHWVDAFRPPLEEKIQRLAAAIKALLKMPEDGPVHEDKERVEPNEKDVSISQMLIGKQQGKIQQEGTEGSFDINLVKRVRELPRVGWIFLIIILGVVFYIGIWPELKGKIYTDLVSHEEEYIRTRDSLLGAMPWLNWIVYDPTHYNPYDNIYPSEASIRQDLIVLRSHSFNGLITMASKGELRSIAQIAHEEGFNKVIVGVWDLRNEEEVSNALQAASHADAYCLGDRGLTKRYSFGELESLMERFRKETHRPVTTTEVIAEYETNPQLVQIGDFLFPDVHTLWQEGQSPQEAWDETIILSRRVAQLVADIPEKQVLLKMVSYPSGGADSFSQETQLEFYRLAVEVAQDQTAIPARVTFSFLCAFDPIWKSEEWGWAKPEQHIGLFTHDRKPKLAVTGIKWEIHK